MLRVHPNSSANTVRTGMGKTEKFVTYKGVRQEGILSSLLFIMVMDQVAKNRKIKKK